MIAWVKMGLAGVQVAPPLRFAAPHEPGYGVASLLVLLPIRLA
jgi:hypothetical protein